jgi:hypothetical protein
MLFRTFADYLRTFTILFLSYSVFSTVLFPKKALHNYHPTSSVPKFYKSQR